MNWCLCFVSQNRLSASVSLLRGGGEEKRRMAGASVSVVVSFRVVYGDGSGR